MSSNYYLVSGILTLGYSIYSLSKYYSMTGKGLISNEKAKDLLKIIRLK
jgi:hypothetical protein